MRVLCLSVDFERLSSLLIPDQLEQVLSQPSRHPPPIFLVLCKDMVIIEGSLPSHTCCHSHLKLSDPWRARMVAGAGCHWASDVPVTTTVLGSLWSSLNVSNNNLIPVVVTQCPEENGGWLWLRHGLQGQEQSVSV